MSDKYGSFQIVVQSSDFGATGASGDYARYQISLAGTYYLTMTNFEMTTTDYNVTDVGNLITIQSPNIILGRGNAPFPTFIYPQNSRFGGNLEITMTAQLQGFIELQIRNFDNSPLPELKCAVISFNYEKLD